MAPKKSSRTLRAEELARDHPPRDVARIMRAEGYDMTPTYAATLASRAGIRHLTDAREEIPWTLKPEHRRYLVPECLRALAARKAGRPVRETMNRALDRMISNLRETDEVMDYFPDCEVPHRVFREVPRRYTKNADGVRVPVDTGWIRDPRINDDGSPRK